MKYKIAVVTDSTAHIPAELLKNLPVFIIPLYVNWGGRSYLDDVDITAVEFYQRLKTEREMPKTAAAAPEHFIQLYQQILDQGYEKIISIHFAGNYSAVCQSARLAAREFPPEQVMVFDSESGSMGLGFNVLEVARAIQTGSDWTSSCHLAEDCKRRISLYFIPGTLEYLRRGGRISNLAAAMGGILQYKPIITLRGGVIEVVDKVRTMHKAIHQLAVYVSQEIGKEYSCRLAFLHSNALHLAQELKEHTYQQIPQTRILETLYTDISSALGTHIGPDAVGVAFIKQA